MLHINERNNVPILPSASAYLEIVADVGRCIPSMSRKVDSCQIRTQSRLLKGLVRRAACPKSLGGLEQKGVHPLADLLAGI